MTKFFLGYFSFPSKIIRASTSIFLGIPKKETEWWEYLCFSVTSCSKFLSPSYSFPSLPVFLGFTLSMEKFLFSSFLKAMLFKTDSDKWFEVVEGPYSIVQTGSQFKMKYFK